MLLEEFLQYENGTDNPPTAYDTNLALQSGSWGWSDLEADEYDLVGWSWQKYDEWFEDEDYQYIDWGLVDYGGMNPHTYEDIKWSLVDFTDMSATQISSLKWKHINYQLLGATSFQTIKWDSVEKSYVKDAYKSFNWNSIKYGKMSNTEYTNISWGDVNFKKYTNKSYKSIKWSNVQFDEFNDQTFKKINWGKVQFNKFNNKSYKKLDWSKVNYKQLSTNSYKKIDSDKINFYDFNKKSLNNLVKQSKKINKSKGDLKISFIKSSKKNFNGSKKNDIISFKSKLNQKTVFIKGGKGSDVFILKKGKGQMVIKDFKNNQDEINFANCGSSNKIKLSKKGKDAQIFYGSDLLATVKKGWGKLDKKKNGFV